VSTRREPDIYFLSLQVGNTTAKQKTLDVGKSVRPNAWCNAFASRPPMAS